MADDTTGTSSSAPATDASGSTGGSRGQHQAKGKTEEILTGDNAAKVQAAVKAAQPDATIERMAALHRPAPKRWPVGAPKPVPPRF